MAPNHDWNEDRSLVMDRIKKIDQVDEALQGVNVAFAEFRSEVKTRISLLAGVGMVVIPIILRVLDKIWK